MAPAGTFDNFTAIIPTVGETPVAPLAGEANTRAKGAAGGAQAEATRSPPFGRAAPQCERAAPTNKNEATIGLNKA